MTIDKSTPSHPLVPPNDKVSLSPAKPLECTHKGRIVSGLGIVKRFLSMVKAFFSGKPLKEREVVVLDKQQVQPKVSLPKNDSISADQPINTLQSQIDAFAEALDKSLARQPKLGEVSSQYDTLSHLSQGFHEDFTDTAGSTLKDVILKSNLSEYNLTEDSPTDSEKQLADSYDNLSQRFETAIKKAQYTALKG